MDWACHSNKKMEVVAEIEGGIAVTLIYNDKEKQVVLREATWQQIIAAVGSYCRLPKNQYKIWRKDDRSVIHPGTAHTIENNTVLLVTDIKQNKSPQPTKKDIATTSLNVPYLDTLPPKTAPNGLVQIFTDLYLGNMYTAKERDLMVQHNIKYIVNVSHNFENFFPETFVYYNVAVQDKEGTNILQYLRQANRFIENSRNCGNGAVLVHCKGGISRSPTVVIAYLMYQYQLSLKHAIGYMKSRKPGINPNPGFMSQLAVYEKCT